jgi:hypothetical protein
VSKVSKKDKNNKKGLERKTIDHGQGCLERTTPYSPVLFCFLWFTTEKRNITDERQALDEILVKLESELTPSSSSSVYLSGGSHPDLGDITVFGVLRSIERLPIFESLIRQRGGPLVEWYDRMTKEMKPPSPPSS